MSTKIEIRHAYRAAFAGLRSLWPQLLAADVAYQAVAMAVLAPLSSLLVHLFVATSGEAFVADQDIVFFLLSPWGIAALVLIAAVGIGIAALELACLMALAFAHRQGRRLAVIQTLRFALVKAKAIIWVAARITLRLLLLAAPFLFAGALVAAAFLRDFDINYYLTERPPAFRAAAILLALDLAGLACLVVPRLLGWAFALPLLLFEDVPPSQALAMSRERVEGRRKTLSIVLLAWAGGVFLFSTLFLGAVAVAGRFLIDFAGDDLALLVLITAGLLVVGSLASYLVRFIGAALLSLLTVVLYERVAVHDAHLDLGEAQTQRAWRLTARQVLWGLVAATVAALLLGFALIETARTERDVAVIAHRGAAGRAPENTMAAVTAAIEDGADWIEIDVQETADGQVAVFHDSDFMKIAGLDLKIWKATTRQLGSIDAGAWFAPEFAGERVPTLNQVLAACKGKAKVIIELKYYGYDERIEKRVIDIVEDLGMESEIEVMSLKLKGVKKVRELRPPWTVGLLAAKAVGDLTRVDADFLAVNTGMVNERFLRRARAAGKEVYAWTVNDAITMSRMIGKGVDGIITDEPALARSVITRRAEMTAVERLLVELAFWFGGVPEVDIARETAGASSGVP